MKTLIVVLFASSIAFAVCPHGSIDDGNGVCAAMPLPSADESTLAPAVGVVSDDKPSRHPEPAYQRGDVIADIVPLTHVDYVPVSSDTKAEAAQQ